VIVDLWRNGWAARDTDPKDGRRSKLNYFFKTHFQLNFCSVQALNHVKEKEKWTSVVNNKYEHKTQTKLLTEEFTTHAIHRKPWHYRLDAKQDDQIYKN
jgi:predicted nucleic acid-binding protein